jgi:hypothetical protein
MANIKIENMTVAGMDLFGNTEDFLKDLSEDDPGLIQGGMVKMETVITNGCTISCTSTLCASCLCPPPTKAA